MRIKPTMMPSTPRPKATPHSTFSRRSEGSAFWGTGKKESRSAWRLGWGAPPREMTWVSGMTREKLGHRRKDGGWLRVRMDYTRSKYRQKGHPWPCALLAPKEPGLQPERSHPNRQQLCSHQFHESRCRRKGQRVMVWRLNKKSPGSWVHQWLTQKWVQLLPQGSSDAASSPSTWAGRDYWQNRPACWVCQTPEASAWTPQQQGTLEEDWGVRESSSWFKW